MSGAHLRAPREHITLGDTIMLQFIQRLINRRDNEKGASAVEYGLLVAAIAAVIAAIVFVLGDNIFNAFDTTNTAIEDNA